MSLQETSERMRQYLRWKAARERLHSKAIRPAPEPTSPIPEEPPECQSQPEAETRPRSVDLTAGIIREVSREFFIHADDIRGPSRKKQFVAARNAAFYLFRKYTTRSYPSIGVLFSGRDHTTVLHGDRRAIQRMEQDPIYRDHIEQIERRLGLRRDDECQPLGSVCNRVISSIAQKESAE